jgi:hypothetical protein
MRKPPKARSKNKIATAPSKYHMHGLLEVFKSNSITGQSAPRLAGHRLPGYA